jgi:gamma-glutamyltranspeptidase/glutathione hydrolase
MLSPSPTRHAPNGMVCSVDHLASEAGVSMMRAGGNAADAAVATSAVLAVTTQHMCGMGGDLFALVHDPAAPGPPAVLNASGRAGSGADADRLRAEGHTTMPFRGDIRSVPVPGCVDGWLALHGAFGRLPLGDVLGPAIAYARDGFPASPLLALSSMLVADVAGNDDFLGAGPLRTGARVQRPGVARALDAVVASGRDGFYGGEFGDNLLALGAGEYTPDDLATPAAGWVDPLRVRAWDHDIWTVPPNSQGYLTLLGSAIADGLDVPADPADGLWPHLLVEAARAAGHDRPAVLHEHADVTSLLAAAAVAERRAAVDPEARALFGAGVRGGGTIYLCAADGDGLGVSLIQSNASGFGAHIVVPGVRIFLQNRGIGFSLEPGHPAEYGPGRRPPHTLSPALVTRSDGSLRMVIGTMGGDTQPQILLQLLTRLLHNGESPGTAIAAARWALHNDGGTGFDTWADADHQQVLVEDHAPDTWDEGLLRRGHDVVRTAVGHGFGHAHVIERRDDGMLAGVADPRAVVGAAAGW